MPGPPLPGDSVPLLVNAPVTVPVPDAAPALVTFPVTVPLITVVDPAAAATAPVSAPPLRTFSVPPLATEAGLVKAPPTANVPPLTVKATGVPVPVIVKVPVPTLVIPVAVIGPENVVDVLLPPVVNVNAPFSAPAPARLPIVSFAASRSVAPDATVVADESPMPVGPTTKVPAFTFVAPL